MYREKEREIKYVFRANLSVLLNYKFILSSNFFEAKRESYKNIPLSALKLRFQKDFQAKFVIICCCFFRLWNLQQC